MKVEEACPDEGFFPLPTRYGARSSLLVILTVLLISLLIGLGTAFLAWPSTIIGGTV